MRRTKAGIILENILHNCKHRWLFCWNGEEDGGLEVPYDCACCMTYLNDEDLLVGSCGCICHQRIEEMARVPHIKLWLLAAKAMDELPPFFQNEDEWMAYAVPVAAAHGEQAQRFGYEPCQCDDCRFVRTVTKRKASENTPAEPVVPTVDTRKSCGCLEDGRPCAKACGLDMTGWKCDADEKK